MLINKGDVREKLKQLGGHTGEVDPLDWLMGHDFGHLKIGRKQGVATQVVLINQLNRLSRLGREKGGSSRRSASPLVPRISSGGGHAFVKLIRNGGTQTARGLRDQMRYLNREGEVEVRRSERFFGLEIDEAQQESLVASWGLDQPNETGVDKTSHFVVSFPPGTDRVAAEKAGRDWAEQLFDSGEFGDVYDYYTVQHNDTAHPHTHVVVNRRGLENGEWLKISKRGPIDYQIVRDVQVEVAEKYGIHLNATPRFARGETDRIPTDVEVKRAEREGRAPRAPEHTEQTATKAAISVLSFAAQISGEADDLKTQYPEISKLMRSISDGMRQGVSVQEMLQSRQVVDLGEAKHMSELLEQSRQSVVANFEQIDAALERLPENSIQRIQFERNASDSRTKAGTFIPQLRQDKLEAERQGSYKGVSISDELSGEIKANADKQVRDIAQASGLDADKTLARYNSSRAATIEQSNKWLQNEISEARQAGFSEHDVQSGHEKIRAVYDTARGQIRAHSDNKREILNGVSDTTSRSNANQSDDVSQERLQRVRNAITPQQRDKLERGDATHLSGITKDPHTQKVIAHEYLNAAIDQASPQERIQLENARATVDQQLEESRRLQKQRELQQQRTSRSRDSGLER